MDIKIYEKVKTFELERICMNGDKMGSFKFIVEIYRNVSDTDKFFPKVYRKETFRIQPTFPQDSSGIPLRETADEEIVVEDLANSWEEMIGKTVEEVLNNVLDKIRSIFF